MITKKTLTLTTSQNLYFQFKHMIPLLMYFLFYMAGFSYVEKTVTKNYYIIHVSLDDKIPFLEIFIIPYLLWFAYVAVIVLYCGMKNLRVYSKLCVFLYTGMTLFLLISFLFPNGHNLRPALFQEPNVFTELIKGLYRTDTPTNIFPSIHVYNSLAVHLSLMNCEELKNKYAIKTLSFVLCISIVCSTVLIKQHSIMDVISAFLLATVMYFLLYGFSFVRQEKTSSITEY